MSTFSPSMLGSFRFKSSLVAIMNGKKKKKTTKKKELTYSSLDFLYFDDYIIERDKQQVR